MGFRILTVNTHSKLSYKNNHLVFRSVDKTEMIHLSEIDILLVETTDVSITSMLLALMIEHKILVVFCDRNRLPIANLMPFYGSHNSSLQLQKQISWDEEHKAIVWTEIIRQKIRNQGSFLREVQFGEASARVGELSGQLEVLDTTNREGTAARLYFNTLFGSGFTRDESNDINAGLDYGYTLLMALFARQIVLCGCMTQLGLKHTNQFNSFNLASDLMEPFRIIVDKIVYEYRLHEFPVIKRMLFTMFEETFDYQGQAMFLTNIVSDYVKKVVKVLHDEKGVLPMFEV